MPSRNISATGSARTSRPICRKSRRSEWSPATPPSPSRASRSTSAKSRAKLGVSHVLEGSVRKAGGRVRINAQLIDGDTGEHVWAERYDRDLEDIFAIQDEISKAIVERAQAQAAARGEESDRAARHDQCRGLQALSARPAILDHRQPRRSAPRGARDAHLQPGGRNRPLLCAGLGAARDRPVEPPLRLRLRGRRRLCRRPHRAGDRSDDRRGAFADGRRLEEQAA